MSRTGRLLPAVAVALLGAAAPLVAHHEILAKFDDSKQVTLTGIVTDVDWKNPHAHVLINVKNGADAVNWAIELESPNRLEKSGWKADSVKPGDTVTVRGIAARNGSHQVWSRQLTRGGQPVLALKPDTPPAKSGKPAPKMADGHPRLGFEPGKMGYWAYPSATALIEDGVTVGMDDHGLLKNVNDASKVAPMQPWALALYKERQKRFLQDDPTWINCKPPGGPRQFELGDGVQFVEDPVRQRIFLLLGGGNSNYRIIYTDGRKPNTGQVAGDDDNPLYYGRATARWEGDTLVSDTEGFNEDFWFTTGGLPHTDKLKLTERFSRPDFDTLRYEVTIDDPGAYTRPWKASWTLRWVADQELPKNFCQDNRP